MDTYGRFLYEFLGIFFSGFKLIFGGLFSGIQQIFNIPQYKNLIVHYKNDFQVAEWLLAILAAIAMMAVVVLSGLLIFFFVRKYLKRLKKIEDQNALLQQIDTLNEQVENLVEEKMKLLSMLPELGIKSPDAIGDGSVESSEENPDGEDEQVSEMDSRFSKLTFVDIQYAKYKQKDYKNTFNLPELCYQLRNFSANIKGLYYSEKLIRLFISALASTKLVILQGISGTGKTSICLAWGDFVKQFPCIASVQPSWRDRTDIFGYLNEFTKKFNETDLLSYLYTAGYTDEVYTVVLDEMNLARVEYYFAEMLSILEMHNTKDWKIEVVQSSWPTDPKKLIRGKLQVPENTWYIGTINNDDSTFMVTDKVYDRAMPIDINEKGVPFVPDDCDAMNINYSYLNGVFQKAMRDYAVTPETLKKIDQMDDYTIKHFRVAFGNRIVKHMNKFVPVYKACGRRRS